MFAYPEAIGSVHCAHKTGWSGHQDEANGEEDEDNNNNNNNNNNSNNSGIARYLIDKGELTALYKKIS